jgi:hypothetical protein
LLLLSGDAFILVMVVSVGATGVSSVKSGALKSRTYFVRVEWDLPAPIESS